MRAGNRYLRKKELAEEWKYLKWWYLFCIMIGLVLQAYLFIYLVWFK